MHQFIKVILDTTISEYSVDQALLVAKFNVNGTIPSEYHQDKGIGNQPDSPPTETCYDIIASNELQVSILIIY